MANLLNVTYTVMNETIEHDTAFVDEMDLDETISGVENVRHTNNSLLMKLNHSPISVELTQENNSYFVKDNLSDADNQLDSISTVKTTNDELKQPELKIDLKRQISIRKCCQRVYNSILKPIKLLRSSASKINTSEELSTISGLQYTSATSSVTSVTQITFDKNNLESFGPFERFKKNRLSSTKYRDIQRPQTLIDNNNIHSVLLANEHVLRKFKNFGDIEIWHI
jgi:hypothetical protein